MAKISEEVLSVLQCPVTGSALIQKGNELESSTPGPDGVPVVYRMEDGIALLLRPEQLGATAS